jgi:hypothetical protein
MRSLITWYRGFTAYLERRPSGLLIFRLPMDDVEVKEYKFVKMEVNPESQDFYFYLEIIPPKVCSLPRTSSNLESSRERSLR